MSIITQKLRNEPLQVSGDTNSINSDCHAIMFDNFGEQGVKIYINDTTHQHTGNAYFYLPPGDFVVFGNDHNFTVKDVFDVLFSGSGTKGMNLVRQFVDRI